ncbi:MAG: type II toxin-antitoxin system death-on-curing family toxin [Rhodospirillaceae bacterium]|nr:type II toxin-antitoxin system death-on-curing family toxin [Rhodospirillaceae bacterium]
MSGWIWVDGAIVLAIHEEQLAEHGGLAGTRDEGMLASALMRPRNLEGYGDPDLYDLAAAYAFGIARNHPFIDGNKRTAFAVAITFLELNGFELEIDDAAQVLTMLGLAAGSVSEPDFAAWLRAHCRKRQP